jgi:hypothetical protein
VKRRGATVEHAPLATRRSHPLPDGPRPLTWRRSIALALAGLLVAGCASHGPKPGQPLSNPVCVEPKEGTFATAAGYFADQASAMGLVDRALSRRGRDGDLIVTDASVRFVSCGIDEAEREVFVFPHDETEMVYRDGSWLFLRSRPYEDGSRGYQGFALHGTTLARGEAFAKAALAEVRRRREALRLFVSSPVSPAINLPIVVSGIPELNLASVDRSQLGKEAGKGVAAGAAGGALAGMNPAAPIILYPPAAVILVVGGAVVGAVTGTVEAEKLAQAHALIVPLQDTVLAKVLHEMAIGPALAKELESRVRAEPRWRAGAVDAELLNCGNRYRDCALRGIPGVVEIAPVRAELRADKAALERDPEQARQALTLFLTVTLYSTLTGHPVETIEITMRSEAHTLAEWRERGGERFRAALQEALEPVPDAVATKLQRALGELLSLD